MEYHEVSQLVAMTVRDKGVKGKSGALSDVHAACSLALPAHLI